MPDTTNMPKYKCHKEVHALKIGRIQNLLGGGAILTPADTEHRTVQLSEEYMQRYQPYPGGYYVVYEDGYESFSPPERFENGYTRMED